MDKKMKLIAVLLLLAMFFSIRQTIKLRNTRQLTKVLLEGSMQMFIMAGDTDDNDQLYWSAYGNMIAASKLYTVLCPVGEATSKVCSIGLSSFLTRLVRLGKTNREDIASLFHLDSGGPYSIDDLLHDLRNMESIDRLNELLDEFDDASY